MSKGKTAPYDIATKTKCEAKLGLIGLDDVKETFTTSTTSHELEHKWKPSDMNKDGNELELE